MKSSKKFKLLSVLSTIVVATSLAATSCAAIAKNNNSNDSTLNSTDISTISWVQRASYDSSIESEIENIVYNDNIVTFTRYPGLQEVVNISASIFDDSVTISIYGDGSKYTSSTSGTSSCKQSAPALIDIGQLNGKMRAAYESTVTNTIVQTIIDDNTSAGAQISDGSNFSINVDIDNDNISVNIIVNNDSQYTGYVRGAATCQYQVGSYVENHISTKEEMATKYGGTGELVDGIYKKDATSSTGYSPVSGVTINNYNGAGNDICRKGNVCTAHVMNGGGTGGQSISRDIAVLTIPNGYRPAKELQVTICSAPSGPYETFLIKINTSGTITFISTIQLRYCTGAFSYTTNDEPPAELIDGYRGKKTAN